MLLITTIDSIIKIIIFYFFDLFWENSMKERDFTTTTQIINQPTEPSVTTLPETSFKSDPN
jgi:hypothetical protein